METTEKTKTFTIEFSVDGGKTWHFGMERSAHMIDCLDEFRSVVRYSQRRHGHGVKTRVIK